MFGELRGGIALAVLLVLTSAALAGEPDTVKVEHKVTLRAGPGERKAKVTDLAPGTTARVLERQGRWLRVKAGASTGWLPRTTVIGSATAPLVSRPVWGSRRLGSSDRGFEVELVAAATVVAEPRPDSAAVAPIAAGARVAVLDARSEPGWLKVRAEGKDGWLRRDAARDTTRAFGQTVAARATPDAARPGPASPRRLAVAVASRLGYRSLDLDFTSDGTGGLGNYEVSSDAGTLELDGEAAARTSSGRLGVALDARFRLSRSAPGIQYASTPEAGDTSFSMYESDVGLRAGVAATRYLEVWARAGYHYGAFIVADLYNPGKLAREALRGVTVGGRVVVHPTASDSSLTLSFDGLVGGRREQTRGLEDGMDDRARAYFGALSFSHHLRGRWSLTAMFGYQRAVTSWTGASNRQPDVTEARRVDVSSLIAAGIAADL